MRRTAFAGVAAALGAAFLCAPAAAQAPPACAKRADILAYLEANFVEVPVAIGLSASGALVEILASDGGRTWTLLFTLPNGMSCLIAAGDDWQFVFSKPRGKGA